MRSVCQSLARAFAAMKRMIAMKMRKIGRVHFSPFVILVTKALMIIFCSFARGSSIPMQKRRPNERATARLPRNMETFERKL